MFERVQIAEVAQIYELWLAYAAAVNDGEMERWISLWIDEGIQMPPDTPRRVGKAEIRKGMQPLFELFDMSKMVIQTEEVRIMGDKAYSHGLYTLVVTPKRGGRAKGVSGAFLGILEKQIDGTWKIAIDCHNYNRPTSGI